MAQKGQKKVSEKYKSITKLLKQVQNLSNETAEKCLKMCEINAKGPTVLSSKEIKTNILTSAQKTGFVML